MIFRKILKGDGTFQKPLILEEQGEKGGTTNEIKTMKTQ